MSTVAAPASTTTAVPPPPHRRAGVLPIVVGALIALGGLAYILWVQLTSPPELRLVDLDVYRSAGESVLTGRPVYEHLTDTPQLLPFTYPPVAALFAIPLALLPWLAVQWLWTLGQLLLLTYVVIVAFRPALAKFVTNWPIVVGVLVVGAGWLLPVRDSIRFGQVDVLLVALCLADCVTPRPRWPRGLLIGLATAVKLTPAVFIPYLWLTGRRRAAYVAAGTTAAATLMAFLVIPDASFDYWGDAFFASDRLGANAGTSNQSLRGMLLRAPIDGVALTLVLAVCIAVVAVVGYRHARDLSAAGDEVAAVAVVGLLAVLLSPVAWIHHLAWVVLAIGVLAGNLSNRRRLLAAIITGVWFGLKIPWYGAHMLKDHVPLAVAIPLQDGFGLAAVILVATLPARRGLDRSGQAGRVAAAPFGGGARA